MGLKACEGMLHAARVGSKHVLKSGRRAAAASHGNLVSKVGRTAVPRAGFLDKPLFTTQRGNIITLTPPSRITNTYAMHKSSANNHIVAVIPGKRTLVTILKDVAGWGLKKAFNTAMIVTVLIYLVFLVPAAMEKKPRTAEEFLELAQETFEKFSPWMRDTLYTGLPSHLKEENELPEDWDGFMAIILKETKRQAPIVWKQIKDEGLEQAQKQGLDKEVEKISAAVGDSQAYEILGSIVQKGKELAEEIQNKK